jgi:hypothetical protein
MTVIFNPNLIFMGKARSLPFVCCPEMASALLVRVKVTNTLAYCGMKLITVVNSFITPALD